MVREPNTGHGVLEETRQKTGKPTLYRVSLLNDDHTTMEFVVQILESVFHKSPAEAYRIMMQGQYLPADTQACTQASWPGANLCPVSCPREMARGDIELLTFGPDSKGVMQATMPGLGWACKRHGE